MNRQKDDTFMEPQSCGGREKYRFFYFLWQ